MRHLVFDQSATYPVALLVKASAFNTLEIQSSYVAPLTNAGIPREEIISFTLAYNEKGKAPVKFIKEYLEQLLPALDSVGSRLLYCADANYFKILTGQKKAEAHLGYVLPCVLGGYEHMQVMLGVNHKSIIYDPKNADKLSLSISALVGAYMGTENQMGKNVLKDAHYPGSVEDIKSWLERLMDYESLSCDIEAASLRFEQAGIGTITFSWDEHSGIAFPVDYRPFAEPTEDGLYGEMVPNHRVRWLLRWFFENYQGTLKWHNSPYDTKVLIYNLWMDNLLDTAGLLHGLHLMHKKIHDTKIIAYLATNSTAGNSLSLKELAHEHAGNYAQEEIKNILKIPLPQLLEYNLVDGVCTNYVFNKFYPIMVADQQEELYRTLMMPSQKVITQVELTGMPLNAEQVQKARTELETIKGNHELDFLGHPIIRKVEDRLTLEAWEKDYADRKAKAKNPDKIMPKDWNDYQANKRAVFNPNSPKQLQILFYDIMGLPIIDLTDTKQPATGGKTIKKLVNHTKDEEHVKALKAIRGWSEAEKILSTFIPAFERAIDKGDGVVYLHGSFNLGGTVSGRLSSSDPNLQNIPSGSTYGKLIKKCFEAPQGWLFSGADFNSLEDYISALTTKDPNKLDVYLKGFDGHSLRAAYYFRDQLPHIDLSDPESVNSIKEEYPELRQDSKSPTFLLTYGGTYHGMINNLGWSEEQSKKIEANYHELYKVSDEWVQGKLTQASKDGYVTVAFGLRVRTPMLAQCMWGSNRVPYEAQAEGRTAGNALGQSYGLLTNRACNEFMEKVWASPYKLDIKPVAMIHDAIYLLIRNDPEVVAWVNRELIKSMQWQELPEIQHDQVKIGAELDIFYPTWADPMKIHNDATEAEIVELARKHQEKLDNKGA
ncbi:DNA polymerase [Marinobacter shengliensis]|uniref:DNA polymerase n=1 Tax=Marinobacter shengliensis TaxID=1389223 RepID=UPI001E5C23CB|nr:DNA polymerase [Marinobacter shengliensis]MCD1628499.1 hypothetical protein [Marinobacter shengliensis]